MSASTASTCPAALPRTVGFVPVRTCRRQRFRKKLSCCAFLVHDDRATYLNEPFISVRPRRVSEKQPARQKSIQLQSINHIAVPTQDVDGLKQFYTEVGWQGSKGQSPASMHPAASELYSPGACCAAECAYDTCMVVLLTSGVLPHAVNLSGTMANAPCYIAAMQHLSPVIAINTNDKHLARV